MPKALKKRSSSSSRASPFSRPSLETELRQAQETGKLRPPKKQRTDRNSKLPSLDDDLDAVNDIIPSALSKKIIQQAQTQQAEEEKDHDEDDYIPHAEEDDNDKVPHDSVKAHVTASDEEDVDRHHKRRLSLTEGRLQQHPLFRLRDESDTIHNANRQYTDDDEEDDDISEHQSNIGEDEETEELVWNFHHTASQHRSISYS